MTEYHSQNITRRPLILFLTDTSIRARKGNPTHFATIHGKTLRPNARKEQFTAAALGPGPRLSLLGASAAGSEPIVRCSLTVHARNIFC